MARISDPLPHEFSGSWITQHIIQEHDLMKETSFL